MSSHTNIKRGYATSLGRNEKARKIELVLGDYLKRSELSGLRILDIGCGSGQIAAYFTKLHHVTVADVVDQLSDDARAVLQSVTRIESRGVTPLESGAFDVVISNHVIAYTESPRDHLTEIARLLKKDGICYLATPNRYFPFEPHTKFPLIHWLPKPIYSRLLKALTGRRERVQIPGFFELWRLFRDVSLSPTNYTARVMRHSRQFGLNTPEFSYFPDLLSFLSPTVIFILVRR